MPTFSEILVEAGSSPGLLRVTSRHRVYAPADPPGAPSVEHSEEHDFAGSPSAFSQNEAEGMAMLLELAGMSANWLRVVVLEDLDTALPTLLSAPVAPALAELSVLLRYKPALGPAMLALRPALSPLALPFRIGFDPAFSVEQRDEMLGALASELTGDPDIQVGPLRGATVAHLRGIPTTALTPLPRVVVVQGGAPEAVRHYVRQLLRAGVLAVLVVVSEPAPGFFPAFYAALVRDAPLDRCLFLAQQAAPTHAFLVAADRGEEAASLSAAFLQGAASNAPRSTDTGLRTIAATTGPTRTPESSRPARTKDALRDLREKNPLTRGSGAAFDASRRALEHLPDTLSVLSDALGARRLSLQEAELHGALSGFEATRRSYREMTDIQAVVDRGVAALQDGGASSVLRQTARTTRVWLQDGQGRLPPGRALVPAEDYGLGVQVGPRLAQSDILQVTFAETDFRKLLGDQPSLGVDVVLFAEDGDLHLPTHAQPLEIPRAGESPGIVFALRPLRPGRLPLRIGLYHRNRLLQSLRVELRVGDETPGQLLEGRLDWAEDTTLVAPVGPSPGLTIFTNGGGQGDHWIGLRSLSFPGGELVALDQRLPIAARLLRDALVECSQNGGFAFGGDFCDLDRPSRAARGAHLVRLACAGRVAFLELFATKVDLGSTLDRPTLISIARCVDDQSSVPWAALYSKHLDVDLPDLALCERFMEQLDANAWAREEKPDGTSVVRLTLRKDLLDDPVACRQQEGCPLDDDADGRVVCPFGFLGFHHDIEQPLQNLPPGEDSLADRETFQVTERIPVAPQMTVRVAYDPFLKGAVASTHAAALDALARTHSLVPITTVDRQLALAGLCLGDSPVQYFFCHGQQNNSIYGLRLGPQTPTFLSAASIPPAARWQGPSLVILNGCDTAGTTPDVAHVFVRRLRALGAVGIVGTETEVYDTYAAPFGHDLVASLLAGKTLGLAVLAARRELLRQLNPMGLTFTYYAPASLRLERNGGAVG